MNVFDLMDMYYPDKKRTISKFRKLDAQANEETHRELEYRIKEHLYPRDPLEFRNWTSAYAYATGDNDNDLRILKKLNKLADEIGADKVLLEEVNGFAIFKFRWFPYTMVRSHFDLFTDFTAKLVKIADNDDPFF